MMPSRALDLRVPLDTGPDYWVRVHAAAPWLNANDRGHWRKFSGATRAWRQAAGWSARAARTPTMERAYILAELQFPNAIHRDPANWYPTVKACVDGLVDVAVLRNDSADYLIGPDLRLGPRLAGQLGALTLHIWRLS